MKTEYGTSYNAYLLTGEKNVLIETVHARCFGSYGWSGEAVPAVLARLKTLGMNTFEEGFKCRFVPSADDLEKAFDFGVRFAQSLH